MEGRRAGSVPLAPRSVYHSERLADDLLSLAGFEMVLPDDSQLISKAFQSTLAALIAFPPLNPDVRKLAIWARVPVAALSFNDKVSLRDVEVDNQTTYGVLGFVRHTEVFED